MTKQEIIQKLSEGFIIVETTINQSHNDNMFQQKDNKWSAAQNVQHLILSIKPLNLAFTLPNFALLFFGKLNRNPRNYDEIVTPKKELPTKEDLIGEFKTVNEIFLKKINDFTEEDLDKYLLPHPLLGKLTLREMLYFTIYHTLHHHKAILFQVGRG